MITKTITPIITQIKTEPVCIGSEVKIYLFGLLVYQKTLTLPNLFGVEYGNYMW